jgi:hypothetical protein
MSRRMLWLWGKVRPDHRLTPGKVENLKRVASMAPQPNNRATIWISIPSAENWLGRPRHACHGSEK